jgi:hypothetical protein
VLRQRGCVKPYESVGGHLLTSIIGASVSTSQLVMGSSDLRLMLQSGCRECPAAWLPWAVELTTQLERLLIIVWSETAEIDHLDACNIVQRCVCWYPVYAQPYHRYVDGMTTAPNATCRMVSVLKSRLRMPRPVHVFAREDSHAYRASARTAIGTQGIQVPPRLRHVPYRTRTCGNRPVDQLFFPRHDITRLQSQHIFMHPSHE